jgi:hypothetical protein
MIARLYYSIAAKLKQLSIHLVIVRKSNSIPLLTHDSTVIHYLNTSYLNCPHNRIYYV